MDPYEELGVAKAASPDEIQAAHRKAVKRHHPDRGGDGSRFDRIQRAFAILRDPEKRRTFDETGALSEEPASSREQRSVAAARAAIMAVVLGQHDLVHTDVLTNALLHVRSQIDSLETRRTTLNVQLARIGVARGRLRNLSDHPDVLGSMFDWQEAEITASLPRVAEEIEVQRGAQEILHRYGYTFEMNGQPVSVSHGPSTLNITVER